MSASTPVLALHRALHRVWHWPLALGLLGPLGSSGALGALVSGASATLAADAPGVLLTDRLVEVAQKPKPGALEIGLTGPAALAYTRGIAAIRAGRDSEALPFLREARALAYHEYQAGPTSRVVAFRHLTRLLYSEEQQTELIDIERQLNKPPRDSLAGDDKMVLLHERALLLHNQFLAVRAFTGEADTRLLGKALAAYEEGMGRPSPLKSVVQVGYAALLGERGDRRGAQAALAKVPLEEQQGERFDLALAYYHLALGDRRQALSRLLQAVHRDSWDHPNANQDGRSVRSTVYRMNDFDFLRDDPLFIKLVIEPEELAR